MRFYRPCFNEDLCVLGLYIPSFPDTFYPRMHSVLNYRASLSCVVNKNALKLKIKCPEPKT